MQTLGNRDNHLGESPFWNTRQKKLFWTDILSGEIFSFSPYTGKQTLELSSGYQTGAFMFSEDDTLMLFTEQGVVALAKTEVGYTMSNAHKLFTVPFINGERFNDAIADAKGRMLAGSMRKSHKEGKLYQFEMGKQPKVLLEGLGISNGMGFSPDQKTFYHTDSISRTVTAYDYNLLTGVITNPRIFFVLDRSYGVPDGLTVNRNGQVWLACWGGSCVLLLSPQGEIIERIDTPALQTSSVCLGDEDFKTLYITSAFEGAVDSKNASDASGRYLGGKVYYTRVACEGIPEHFVSKYS